MCNNANNRLNADNIGLIEGVDADLNSIIGAVTVLRHITLMLLYAMSLFFFIASNYKLVPFLISLAVSIVGTFVVDYIKRMVTLVFRWMKVFV